MNTKVNLKNWNRNKLAFLVLSAGLMLQPSFVNAQDGTPEGLEDFEKAACNAAAVGWFEERKTIIEELKERENEADTAIRGLINYLNQNNDDRTELTSVQKGRLVQFLITSPGAIPKLQEVKKLYEAYRKKNLNKKDFDLKMKMFRSYFKENAGKQISNDFFRALKAFNPSLDQSAMEETFLVDGLYQTFLSEDQMSVGTTQTTLNYGEFNQSPIGIKIEENKTIIRFPKKSAPAGTYEVRNTVKENGSREITLVVIDPKNPTDPSDDLVDIKVFKPFEDDGLIQLKIRLAEIEADMKTCFDAKGESESAYSSLTDENRKKLEEAIESIRDREKKSGSSRQAK